MMMDAPGDGFHMWWMAVPAIAVLAATGWLVLQIFTRPSQALLDRTMKRLGPDTTALTAGPRQGILGTREDMLIVIPDISGYTKFVTRSCFALSHAHLVVTELLAAVMSAGSRVLMPMRLEGDAVVFHADAEKVQPVLVGKAVVEILNAFYRRRGELARENICRCGVCNHIEDLELKIVIHHGEVLKYRMGDLEDVTGEAMIAAHRLLKNKVEGNRYVLVTEPATDLIVLPGDWERTPYLEELEGLGGLASHVFTFARPTFREEDIERFTPAIGRSTRDLSRKMRAAFVRN